MNRRMLVWLPVLAVIPILAASCGATPTDGVATGATDVVATEAPADTSEPASDLQVPADSGVAGVEFTTCEALIAEGEKGLGADFAIAMYAGMLEGVIAGEPVNGEVIELTDSQRAVWQSALDVLVEDGTYCGIVPVEPEKRE